MLNTSFYFVIMSDFLCSECVNYLLLIVCVCVSVYAAFRNYYCYFSFKKYFLLRYYY